jgi:acyl carrier protein
MSDEVRPILAGLVAGLASPPIDPAAVQDTTGLLDDGLGLDSVALLELVVLLEERLGVVVSSEDVGAEHFTTFGSLLAFVTRQRG